MWIENFLHYSKCMRANEVKSNLGFDLNTRKPIYIYLPNSESGLNVHLNSAHFASLLRSFRVLFFRVFFLCVYYICQVIGLWLHSTTFEHIRILWCLNAFSLWIKDVRQWSMLTYGGGDLSFYIFRELCKLVLDERAYGYDVEPKFISGSIQNCRE